MGLCGSSMEELATSRKLQDIAEMDFHRQSEKVRLLLLGAGESGKSTIFKQMKILYGTGFTPDEIERWRSPVYSNTIACMKAICAAAELFGLSEEIQCKDDFSFIMDLSATVDLDTRVALAIKTLWADPAIQKAWQRRSEFQVMDTCAHFFLKVDEIALPTYTPNQEDILHLRVRTSGIVEESFLICGLDFVIIDVGGQRNERKKWIHCFDSVNAVIFVAALSEYDQVLFEDNNQNRMIEAITLFEEICNSRWFREIDIILFLNKRDLYMEKISRVHIASVPEFSDYTGEQGDSELGVQYFLGKFLSQNRFSRDIYHHVTCATDSTNVRVVFEACRQIILKKNLEGSGFGSV